ncbi:MAG: excinuclease ABC subunit UvrC [Bdellovibrio sp.]|nr:excinuclease ABC subunit UvrC [Bdellovibrio sp.]
MENQASKPNQAPRTELLERAREAKTGPGVYLMKDIQGVVLYIGKAKNLRNRLVSYFQSSVHEIPRVELWVSRVQRFDVILTETEAEALILEATLVKKNKPKFNIRLKDDKAYPYLKIQINDSFPRIEMTRKVLSDGARYFGPFPSSGSARQVMHLLNETFSLRDCSENVFRHRSRPCILHQMGRCTAPCVNLIEANQYRDLILEVIRVLEGKADRVIHELRVGMNDAAENEEFEQAAFFRDQIQNLDLITQTQAVFEAGSQKDRDVVGLARHSQESANGHTEGHATVLKIRKGKLIAVQHFRLQNTDITLPVADVLSQFLVQYYLPAAQSGDGISEEVLLPEAPLDLDLLEKALGIKPRLPENPVDQQLLNVARTNAEYALEQNDKKERGHGIKALEEIQTKLHLQRFPSRIECYDNSNIQGADAVASRVVFVDGAPDKNLYRRYKIRTIEGANDFGTMKEVLGRRFSNSEEDLPDLVVVDGGKGQLAQAVAIFEELGIQGVGVVGLAKARVEKDFQAAEVKSSFERIFIPNRKNPVPLLPHTEAYKLLTHIRDEAHRFAIQYHRLLRSKRTLKGTKA